MNRFNFWLTNVVASNHNIINLKLFLNHGRIERFRKKLKKNSGEINPLGVHRNMRGCICEVNCKEHEGWDFLQKKGTTDNGVHWFWIRKYRHLCTLVLEAEENFMQSLSVFVLLFWWQKKKKKLVSSVYYWILLICLAAVKNWGKDVHFQGCYVVDVSRSAGGRVSLFSFERLKGAFRKLLSLENLYQRFWIWNID